MVGVESKGWALVAGASGGVGGAVSRALAEEGWDLVLTYHHNRTAVDEVAKAVAGCGRSAVAAQLDLTDERKIAEVLGATAPEPLSGVVYAAGPHVTMDYISRISPRRFRDQMNDDAAACYALLHLSVDQLRQTSGSMVAVVTPAVQRYAKKDLLSSAPKAAIQAIIRGIAVEEGRNGIRANCVGVGLLEGAGMWGALHERGDYNDEFLTVARRNIPLGRFGHVDDVANAVRFLLSPEARWITGQTLNVDGGYSA